jgi:ectoine hydroxylase-related dioxygenase (phytanoyl-CoA dioxygenase family)
MPALQHFLKNDDPTSVFEAIEADGACVLDDLVTPEFCGHITDDFLSFIKSADWGENEIGLKDEFFGAQTKRLHGLFSKSPLMVQVLMNPFLLSLAEYFLKSDKRAHDFRLSNAELMVLNQNQTFQEFHTDGGSWHRAQKHEGRRNILISANIALTEFTQDNGATRVVPGSHRWSNGRKPVDSEVCLAVMPRGAALLYSGNVLHSGGANSTPEMRIGLYLGYLVSWLRPIENQLATNSPEDIAALSEEAQRLLDVVPGGFTVIA